MNWNEIPNASKVFWKAYANLISRSVNFLLVIRRCWINECAQKNASIHFKVADDEYQNTHLVAKSA